MIKILLNLHRPTSKTKGNKHSSSNKIKPTQLHHGLLRTRPIQENQIKEAKRFNSISYIIDAQRATHGDKTM